jgi:FtsH-binding integral membrane protein
MKNRNRKTSSFIKAVGMVITALFFVWSIVSSFSQTPQIKDWRIIALVSFIIFIGFVIWHFWDLQKEIQRLKFENDHPVLKIYQLPEFSVLRVPPRNKLSTTSANPIVARMKFYNQPTRQSDNSIARKVAIQLTAYDINWKPILNSLNGI